jgi:LPS-assembly protein
VFDSGVIDLNFSSLFAENQFSGNDRINNANQISAGLTTRFIESDTGMQRLSASIGQRYYFSNQKVALDYTNPAAFRQNNSSDIIAGLSANLKTNWKVDAFLRYNTLTAATPNQTITSRYSPEPGKVLNLSYSHRNDALSTIYFAPGTSPATIASAIAAANVDQFNVSGQWPLKPGWFAVGRINYSIQTKQMIESLAGVEYNAGCWIARSVIQRISTIATIPTATSGNANYALFFQLELGGLASIGANPLGIIKRSVPGYVNTGLMSETYQ